MKIFDSSLGFKANINSQHAFFKSKNYLNAFKFMNNAVLREFFVVLTNQLSRLKLSHDSRKKLWFLPLSNVNNFFRFCSKYLLKNFQGINAINSFAAFASFMYRQYCVDLAFDSKLFDIYDYNRNLPCFQSKNKLRFHISHIHFLVITRNLI